VYVISEREEGGFQMITFDYGGRGVWAGDYMIKMFLFLNEFS
jgi:hypothetical protein